MRPGVPVSFDQLIERALRMGASKERLHMAGAIGECGNAALAAAESQAERMRIAALVLALQSKIAEGLREDEAWMQQQRAAEAKAAS
jgi:hypothetical protein